MKIRLPECDYCHNKVTANQLIRFAWKNKKKKLDLCPTCFNTIWGKHLKEVQMPVQEIMGSGYWEEGARENDFKSYLERWAKRTTEML
jgi:protein-disulfide isomerase